MSKNPEADALRAHVADMQGKALRIQSLLEVVMFIENENACEAGRFVMTEIALETAEELNLGLDSVSLPKVAT